MQKVELFNETETRTPPSPCPWAIWLAPRFRRTEKGIFVCMVCTLQQQQQRVTPGQSDKSRAYLWLACVVGEPGLHSSHSEATIGANVLYKVCTVHPFRSLFR